MYPASDLDSRIIGNTGSTWITFEDVFEIDEFYNEIADSINDKILIADSTASKHKFEFDPTYQASVDAYPGDLTGRDIEISSLLEKAVSFTEKSENYSKDDIFVIYDMPTLPMRTGQLSASRTGNYLQSQFRRTEVNDVNSLFLDVTDQIENYSGPAEIDIIDYSSISQ